MICSPIFLSRPRSNSESVIGKASVTTSCTWQQGRDYLLGGRFDASSILLVTDEGMASVFPKRSRLSVLELVVYDWVLSSGDKLALLKRLLVVPDNPHLVFGGKALLVDGIDGVDRDAILLDMLSFSIKAGLPVEAIDQLLRLKPNLYRIDSAGQSLVSQAAQYSQPLVDLLLAAGAPDDRCPTVFGFARGNFHSSSCQNAAARLNLNQCLPRRNNIRYSQSLTALQRLCVEAGIVKPRAKIRFLGERQDSWQSPETVEPYLKALIQQNATVITFERYQRHFGCRSARFLLDPMENLEDPRNYRLQELEHQFNSAALDRLEKAIDQLVGETLPLTVVDFMDQHSVIPYSPIRRGSLKRSLAQSLRSVAKALPRKAMDFASQEDDEAEQLFGQTLWLEAEPKIQRLIASNSYGESSSPPMQVLKARVLIRVHQEFKCIRRSARKKLVRV